MIPKLPCEGSMRWQISRNYWIFSFYLSEPEERNTITQESFNFAMCSFLRNHFENEFEFWAHFTKPAIAGSFRRGKFGANSDHLLPGLVSQL